MMTAQRFADVVVKSKSPLDGVSPLAWRRFVDALCVQEASAVSASGGLGEYDIRPRRLVELGYASGLRRERAAVGGRQVQTCVFVPPWTQARFLADTIAQYAALSKSISLYYRALVNGELKRPEGLSMAGALAILHVGGRGALQGWPKLFDNTRARYEAARKAF
jgi:hypothetical protein